MAYSQRNYPPQQKITFGGLQPGVKYRVRVRAVDGEGNVGSYSDHVDIIAGLGDSIQPNTPVAGLSVTPRTLGVDVEWSLKSGARGYLVYATSGATTPADPDPANQTHLVYRGNSRKINIPAEAEYYVKALVLWYDQFGRKTSESVLGSGQALSVS